MWERSCLTKHRSVCSPCNVQILVWPCSSAGWAESVTFRWKCLFSCYMRSSCDSSHVMYVWDLRNEADATQALQRKNIPILIIFEMKSLWPQAESRLANNKVNRQNFHSSIFDTVFLWISYNINAGFNRGDRRYVECAKATVWNVPQAIRAAGHRWIYHEKVWKRRHWKAQSFKSEGKGSQHNTWRDKRDYDMPLLFH